MSLTSALCVIFTLAAPSASATHMPPVVYAPPPPFCEGSVVHDYLAPLKRMPKLHAPHPSGRIGFGPVGVHLRSLSSLVVGEGDVGYTLYLEPSSPGKRLGWRATTVLSRTDWQGRPLAVEDRKRQRITHLSRTHNARVRFAVNGPPGPYRLDVTFRSRAGRELGSFGFYFRVVPLNRAAGLSVNADTYRPGDSVFGRVENFGTAIARYGAPYAIERLDGSTWALAPESPRGAWILPLYGAGPGTAGTPCSSFRIPPSMPPGRYRMTKEVAFEPPPFRASSPETILTAEFDVVP